MGDITYLRVGTSWRYLAVVMDQYSRRVLAWALTRRRTAAVTCGVLTRAAHARGVIGARGGGVIFRSDRGSEYMGAPFCAHLPRLGLMQDPKREVEALRFVAGRCSELHTGERLVGRSPAAA